MGFSLGDLFKTVALIAAGPMGWSALAAEAAMKALEPEIPKPEALTNLDGIKINSRKVSSPLPILYGKQLVGGNDVFIQSAGSDNKNLWIVQTLAEGECDSIYEIASVPQVFVDDRIYTEFGGNVSYWFHNGSLTQTVDTNLNTAISAWTDCLRGTCYIVWKFVFDQDKFQGVPKRQVVLKGKKVYNPITLATAWTDNAALCLYDFMAGRGITIFDATALGAAIDYCETKNWRVNLVLNESGAKAGDAIHAMMQYFRGRLNWWAGTYYLRYADLAYESSVATLTDADLILDESSKLPQVSVTQPGRFDRPAGMKVRYIDPENEWSQDTVSVGETSERVDEVDLSGCASRAMAGQLGSYMLERKLLDRSLTLTVAPEWIKLEPGDPITLTLEEFGITAQPMRVSGSELKDDGTVDLTLLYDQADLYDDDYDSAVGESYTCTLPDITAAPPGVANVQISEEVYHYRLRSFTRLNVTFDPPSIYPWYDYVEVWRSFDDVTYEHLFNTTGDFALDPVEEGQIYYIKLRVVSIHGVKQATADAYKVSRTVVGKTTAPASLTYLAAIVNDNAINIYSDKVSDPDVELYEFRLNGWDGGIFLGAYRSPNLSLKGIKPGSFTFYCNTLSNNGEYGDTPRSAAAELPEPPLGWTVQDTDTCDYSTGTHSNTEQVTYDSEYYLKCSHTGSVLVGTYASPIYDLGASGQYLIYVLAAIVVTGTGTTWADKAPDPTTWAQVNAETRTWAQIFELTEAPSVKMKIKYGETSPPANSVTKMEILSAIVTGRYFQVEIEITDPGTSVNALVENFSLKYCQ